jgi:DNA mismatch repair protein MutS2
MDEKTINLLEFPKILEGLAQFCAFSASAEKARLIRPSNDLDLVLRLQAETREALQLQYSKSDLTIGGARDVRGPVDLANHGGVLTPQDLLDVKSTLVAARTLARNFERMASQFPYLAAIAAQLPPPVGLIDAITKAISDRGEILDSASIKLEIIRRDLRIAHDRLMSKLQRLVTDPKNTPYLQEALITQRDGRYVLPLKSEYKGQIRSIVHDQSASGATLFVEPLAVVELNNQYRELQLAERDEERRILTELSSQVARYGYEILATVDVIADIDLAFARGKYADKLRASEPELRPINPQGNRHPGTQIQIFQARHPLLNPDTVVPIDFELDSQTYAVVITGPNTGGKTVTLKTIGLLVLMAQSGLHIPAHPGAVISLFDLIFADIGDEQSIEQSLSTFSGHITNIIRILNEADPRSLVILDELGAGTDPTEGAALARAILRFILERRITTLVTTHHPELKAFAHATAGVVNASVEFDLDTLRPTYHLTIGLPGRSNALAIAQRLGLPEEIITEARAELSPDDLRAEDLLNEIHHQRDIARQARLAAERSLHDAEQVRSELISRLEKIEDERRKILEQAKAEAEVEIRQLQAEINDIRRQLARARQPVEALKPIVEQVDKVSELVEQPIERAVGTGVPGQRRSIRLGDKVRLRSLGMQGVVTSWGEEEAEVQVGSLRVRARQTDLELIGSGESRSSVAAPSPRTPVTIAAQPVETKKSELYTASPGMELDLRGRTSDEALDTLDRYLDSAYLAGLPFVRIIHGKGTGRLRQVVRQALKENQHVKSFETGGEKEGGEGVTVVKLAV